MTTQPSRPNRESGPLGLEVDAPEPMQQPSRLVNILTNLWRAPRRASQTEAGQLGRRSVLKLGGLFAAGAVTGAVGESVLGSENTQPTETPFVITPSLEKQLQEAGFIRIPLISLDQINNDPSLAVPQPINPSTNPSETDARYLETAVLGGTKSGDIHLAVIPEIHELPRLHKFPIAPDLREGVTKVTFQQAQPLDYPQTFAKLPPVNFAGNWMVFVKRVGIGDMQIYLQSPEVLSISNANGVEFIIPKSTTTTDVGSTPTPITIPPQTQFPKTFLNGEVHLIIGRPPTPNA